MLGSWQKYWKELTSLKLFSYLSVENTTNKHKRDDNTAINIHNSILVTE